MHVDVSSSLFLPCVAGLFITLVDELFVRHLNLKIHLRFILIVHQVIGVITASFISDKRDYELVHT